MKITIKEMDKFQRPRERLIMQGHKSLSDQELLAIIIGTGNKEKNVIELSEEILHRFSYEELLEIEVEELIKINGIKEAKASSIVASLQFGRRVSEKVASRKRPTITGANDVYELMRDKLAFEKREYFYTLLLNTKNEVMSKELISIGDLNSSIVNPREVFKNAVKKSANSVILVHNHPSGNPKASKEDIIITKRLVEAGKILDISVLDHIIIGINEYYSLKRENYI